MFQFATLFSIVALLAMSKVASAEDFPGQRVNIEVVGTPDAPTELIVGDNAGVWSLTYLAVIGDPNKPDEKLWQRVIFDGVTREETLEPIGEAKWKVKLSKGIIPEIRECSLHRQDKEIQPKVEANGDRVSKPTIFKISSLYNNDYLDRCKIDENKDDDVWVVCTPDADCTHKWPAPPLSPQWG